VCADRERRKQIWESFAAHSNLSFRLMDRAIVVRTVHLRLHFVSALRPRLPQGKAPMALPSPARCGLFDDL
jgi:hypothetical protein